MHQFLSKKSAWIFILLAVSICGLLFYGFGKTNSLLLDSIENFGHLPLFCLVACMVLWLLDRENWPCTERENYLKAGGIASALAVLSEILQAFTPERYFEVQDIFHDLFGIAIFLMVAYQYKRSLPGRIRLILTGVSLALVALASFPVLASALDTLRTQRDFPLISSFETRLEMDRWKSDEMHARVPLHATHGEHSLRVDLSPGEYPGVSLSYPPRDWRGYRTLVFDAFLDGAVDLPLTVRVNDLKHNEQYDDRYNRRFLLHPGANTIAIDLQEVEHAPKGRSMDMGNISILCLFSYNLKNFRTVYFDNFRLKNRG